MAAQYLDIEDVPEDLQKKYIRIWHSVPEASSGGSNSTHR